MTVISSIPSWNATPVRSPASSAQRADAQVVQKPAASTIVKLSPQSLSASASGRPGLSWESTAQDGVSALMAANVGARSAAGRFSGLGAALLGQFRGEGGNISQSVQLAPAATPASPYGVAAATPASPYGVAAAAPALHGLGNDKISLSISSKSGVDVTLSLDNTDDGLAVRMSSSAELSDAERSALAGLADGFQEAIDGITQDPPSVRLQGLTQCDPAVLASVDLRATIKLSSDPEATQSLALHADGAQREVSLSGPSGSASVSVDTSNLAGLGSPEQQARALASHLKQFDQAASRGRADTGLMTMFKEAFTGINTNVGAAQPRGGVATGGKWELAADDHAALSGLADFSASVSQASTAINPMRPGEQDSFAYELSQSTSVGGPSRGERTVSQQQKSELNASFHTPSTPGAVLRLDHTEASQNYDYHQIKDAASSDVDLAYSDGYLVKATLNQSASQSARVLSYVMGKLVSEMVTPGQQSFQRDLLAALAPYLTGQTRLSDDQKDEQRQQSLSSLSEQVLLKGYP
ncbi:hypothetical protein [Massilia genomosp. 1]|uniref:Lactate dehydrogenase n=1 Tax=Massilia genomosp. 1 TaxID=2609280 RepID=A0ABX0N554_9BURK|nr:hypothetical protein [Massilia genomosp. 1]NHZ66664.1 hypothetical protein [Massilia genomosp. 1]